jgi:ribosomal protein S19
VIDKSLYAKIRRMKAQGKEVTLKVFSTKATVKPNAIKKIKA